MAFLITESAVMLCRHGGPARNMPAPSKVRIAGGTALNQNAMYSITGCGLSSSGSPCATAQFVTAATRVRIGGAPALISSGEAVCSPTGTGLQIVMTQTRVRGQ